MEYELKFGPVGKVMDAIMVRKKWDAGIKGFFAGLKHYVETGRRPLVFAAATEARSR